MKRKDFLLWTIAGAGTWLAPSCEAASSPALSRPLFLSTICDSQTLKQIGAAYCNATPEDANEHKLIGILAAGIRNDNKRAQTIDNQIRQEYAEGRLITVDGWVLSVTEARQCALYALQNP